ncbi:MAG: hypothetical protein O7B99_10885, partial [Planctomycetota bacterium]|nr:hypothetical protein [Planctomycetota bacterium]
RSVDGDGNPVSLGVGVTVDVTLSPFAFQMLEQVEAGETADPLAETSFSFQTQDIEAPLAGTILSMPTDAIGILNLTAGDPNALMVEVTLDAGLDDDVLTLILFGLSKDSEPQLVALSRTVELSGAGMITTVNLDLGEIDLADGVGTAKLADGSVAFAFSLQRGSQTTPVRLLDVDVAAAGLQDPLLDTVAPTVEEFLHPGGTTDFARSDQRDIVITGVASEPLRDVEVMVSGRPTVTGLVGSDEDGLFIAPPVSMPMGIAVGPMDFDLRVFDVALNASPTVSGTFNQLGVVGPTLLASPGDPITVEVFDALTLEPVGGARVFTHSDVGDMVTFDLVDTDVTVGGTPATVFSAGAGAVATILTVEATGYDIFTYHGVITDRISVPLTPSLTLPATTTGDLTTTSEFAALALELIDRRFDDTRRFENATPVFAGSACIADPFGGSGIACPYGPEPILPVRIGALSFVGGNFALAEPSFSAAALLQAFDLVVPVPEAPAASLDLTSIDLAFLLNEPGVPTEELPIELPPTTLDTSGAFLLDTANLSDDVDTTGVPRITVDTIVPGVPGSLSVGFGLAFETVPLTTWNVRAAYPGAVGPAGFFGLGGVVDTDLFLRAELREIDGDRSGRRPRMSDLASLSPLPFVLFVPDLPEVGTPAAGGSSGGVSYNVVFNNGIVDLAAQTGLYRVTLIDQNGRRWILWRDDPPDPDTAFVHLPDLSPTGTPLADGPITCFVTGWAWPTLSLDAFLFSDVEREHDIFCETSPIVFTQP